MGFGILNIANHIVNWSYCTVLFVNFDIAAICLQYSNHSGVFFDQ